MGRDLRARGGRLGAMPDVLNELIEHVPAAAEEVAVFAGGDGAKDLERAPVDR